MIKFAVFVCTHGRPAEQLTAVALRRCGYTGEIILLLDDEDETYDEYVKNFPDWHIEVFNKQHYIDTIDTGTNVDQRKCIIYAKCAADDIAHKLGLDAYVVTDDDLLRFRHRFIYNNKLCSMPVTNMDEVLLTYANYVCECNIAAMSFGDIRLYMSGVPRVDRVPYTFVFRNTAIQYDWHSSMYEDTVTPVLNGMRGALTLELPDIQLDVKMTTSSTTGGMADVYATMSIFSRAGTVMLYHPSCVKYANNQVGFVLTKNKAFPKILSFRYRKEN